MQTKFIDDLNDCIKNGVIRSFEVIDLNEQGNPEKGTFGNYQKLNLTFPNGKTVTICTDCVGVTGSTRFV